MTEEDQKLVALAALHGARFTKEHKLSHGMMWSVQDMDCSKWTVGRAAEFYLWKCGLRSDAEHEEYDHRTDIGHGEDVDEELLNSQPTEEVC